VIIRKMSSTETPGRIVFYFASVGTIVSAIPAMLSWVSLNWVQFGSLVAIAVFSTIAQLSISKAYSHAPAGQLGPYTYTSVAFAAFFGWLIWGEVLNINTLIGILIIVLAGVLAMTDRRISRIKAEQKQTVFNKGK
jgi:drug/metabolite transporter (DMT)-like permease